MKNVWFINASNIHMGGGRSLLILLLDALIASKQTVELWVDARIELEPYFYSAIKIHKVKANLFKRFLVDFEINQLVEHTDKVLYFGNLPPIRSINAHVTLFLQNRYLVDGKYLSIIPFKTRLRYFLEIKWLKFGLQHVNKVLVQTPSMQEAFKQTYNSPSTVAGFSSISSIKAMVQGKREGFIYVASSEVHKNHRKLIEAWIILAKANKFPLLKLTLSHSDPLWLWIEQQIAQYKLNIYNLGPLTLEQVVREYRNAEFLIFPSLFESFGLPLLEGVSAGLPVLASNLPYVKDVIQGATLFDPEDAQDIALKVQQGYFPPAKVSDFILGPDKFLELI